MVTKTTQFSTGHSTFTRKSENLVQALFGPVPIVWI